jgi:hypothetical protein
MLNVQKVGIETLDVHEGDDAFGLQHTPKRKADRSLTAKAF